MNTGRSEDNNDHRSQSKDRNGLTDDGPWHDRFIHHTAKNDANRKQHTEQGANREPQQSWRQCDPTMVHKAAFRGDLFSKNSVEHFHRHLMRRRQVWAFPNVGQRDQMWVFERKDKTICLLARNWRVGRHTRATALCLICRQMHIHRHNRQGPDE